MDSRSALGTLTVTANGPGALGRELGARLRDMILDGRWPAGARLPSSRALARELGVARETASRALHRLAEEGLIELRPRAGAMVAAHAGRSPAPPPPAEPLAPRLPLSLDGLAEELFQPALWQRCLPRTEPVKPPEPALRQAIADMLAAQRGLRCRAEQVVLTTGATHALRMVLGALGRAAPRSVTDEAPALPATGPLLVYPAVHPVTCATLPEPTRQTLLDWIAPPERALIEIDTDWDLVAAGTASPAPLRANDPDIVHIGSFNRLLFPGLRIGYLVAPDWLAGGLARAPAEPPFAAPLLATLHAFITGGSLAVHLRQRLSDWRERRDWLLARLPGLFTAQVNRQGPHLVLAPFDQDATIMVAAFARAGLAATALRALPGRADGPDRLLIGLAGTGPEARAALEARLEQALAECRRLPR